MGWCVCGVGDARRDACRALSGPVAQIILVRCATPEVGFALYVCTRSPRTLIQCHVHARAHLCSDLLVVASVHRHVVCHGEHVRMVGGLIAGRLLLAETGRSDRLS